MSPSKPNGKNNTKPNSNSATNKKADKVVAKAKTYIGTKYKYGGTTKSGMDCSGLMCVSFSTVGITLPRTSSAQKTFNPKVALKNIQKGDMVFFTDKPGHSKITHVGLVTQVKSSTEILFIHSSSSKGVMESNLLSNYWKGVYISANRPKY